VVRNDGLRVPRARVPRGEGIGSRDGVAATDLPVCSSLPALASEPGRLDNRSQRGPQRRERDGRDPKYDVLFEPIHLGPKAMTNHAGFPIGAVSAQKEPVSQAFFRALKDGEGQARAAGARPKDGRARYCRVPGGDEAGVAV
jgi:hypothetical protein